MIYRNYKILQLAKEVPYCMLCGVPNQGQIVACHSNQGRDGKGTGIKSSDYRIAYLCHPCHYEIDDGKKLTKQQRVEKWEEGHRDTIGWLFEEGKIIVC